MGTFLSVKAQQKGVHVVVGSLPPTMQHSDPVILPEPAGSVPAHKETPEAGARGAILFPTVC